VTQQAKIYWQMGRKISVDEAVIPFKGRHKGRYDVLLRKRT
jgi:hypothetical protein